MIQIAIILFTFITAIDITVLATIVPYIIASLGDMQLYPLMSSAYLVSSFVSTPVFGKIADQFGCKRAALIALNIFLIGSLCAGLATSMTQLIIFRLIQGVGAAGLINISFIIVGRLYKTDAQRSFMQAILSSIWATASIIGPLLGAYLTLRFSWRWVFFINVPIGGIAAIFWMTFKEEHARLRDTFDLRGVFLFTGSVLLFFFTLMKITDTGMNFWKGTSLILAIIFLIIFIKRCWRLSSPLIPLRLLGNPLIFSCIIFGVISGACLTTSSTLISLFVQGALRQSLQNAGFVITATSIGWTIGSFFCGFLLHRIGLRQVALVSITTLCCAFTLLSQATLEAPMSYFMVVNAILGFGIGSMVNMTITAVQKVAHTQFLGRTTSFLSLMRSFGMSFGSAGAGFLQLYYFHSQLVATTVVPRDVAAVFIKTPSKFLDPKIAESLSHTSFTLLCEMFAYSIQNVFFFPIVVLIVTIPLIFFLPKHRCA